jgi:5-formyltetrahydrofolate cyclo-ligase
MTKTEWRKMIKQKLLSMEGKDRRNKSEIISSHLYQTEQWESCKSIGITVSRKFEIDTSFIIKKAWEEGKTVCVPKCYSSDKKMEFRELQSFNDLENVYMDLFEPCIEKTKKVLPDQMDLIVVPGLVFDSEGYRIGYGGGYYDRYLERYTGSTVSLAYSFQTTDHIPRETFDIPVEQVIMEEGRFV